MSADLLLKTPIALNAVKDRELSLRDMQIPAIENLGVTKDQIESLDLSNNAIASLSNLPRLVRLRHLLLAGNPVSSITPALAAQLPTLISLTLTGCKLADLPDLDPLAGCKHLEFLSLKDSPVTSLPHYRHWVIHRCRKVRVLDFEHVTEKERKRAAELFVVAGTANEPTPLAASISTVDPAAPPAVPVAKTFTPGEATGASGKGRKLTDEERARVRRAIESAKTVEEMRMLRRQLDEGYVPDVPAGKGAPRAMDVDA